MMSITAVTMGIWEADSRKVPHYGGCKAFPHCRHVWRRHQRMRKGCAVGTRFAAAPLAKKLAKSQYKGFHALFSCGSWVYSRAPCRYQFGYVLLYGAQHDGALSSKHMAGTTRC